MLRTLINLHEGKANGGSGITDQDWEAAKVAVGKLPEVEARTCSQPKFTYASLLTPEAREKWYAEFRAKYCDESDAVIVLTARLFGVDEDLFEDDDLFKIESEPVPLFRIPILNKERMEAIERLQGASDKQGRYGRFEDEEDEEEFEAAAEELEDLPEPDQWLEISAEDPPAWFMAEHLSAEFESSLSEIGYMLSELKADHDYIEENPPTPKLRDAALKHLMPES